MRIKKFRIQNFKSIIDTGDIFITNNSLITILAGQNESGKTSLLKAFKFFEEGAYEDFDDDKRLNTHPKIEITFSLTDEEYEDLKNMTNEEIADYFREHGFTYLRGETDNDNYDSIKYYTLPEDLKTKIDTLNNVSDEEAAESESQLEDTQNDEEKKTFDPAVYFKSIRPKFVYYSSFDGNILPGKIKITEIPKNQAVLDFQKVYEIDFTDLVKDTTASAVRQQAIQRVREEANDSLNTYWNQKISGEKAEYNYTIDIQKQIAPNPSTIEFFVDQNDLMPLKMSQKSQGFRWFTGFILRLRAHEKELENENIILLVDEPGQGLHETAQRDVRKVIEEISKKSNLQIIYSTHQPILLGESNIDFSRLLLVEKTKSKGSEFKTISQAVSQKGMKDALSPVRAALGLLSILDPTKTNKAIVTEGITEWYYINCLCDTTDFLVVPSSGVDQIPNIYAILLGMGVNARVLVDDDQQGKSIFNKIKKCYFENDETGFKKAVLKIDNKIGIEELLLKSDVKPIFAELNKTYDDSKSVLENIAIIGKVLFAKYFYDKYKDDDNSLTQTAKAAFKQIEDFAKS